MPSDDPTQLCAVAAELERHAAYLRMRAATVAADPERVRWSSLGARAWAESVARIREALIRAADQLEHAATALRGQAAVLASRTAGR